jgi:hypothetical protein
MVLALQPISIKEAKAFIERHHRHHPKCTMHRFAVAVNDGTAVVGVAIVGDPAARMDADGYTAEVRRLCTIGERNACSMLYAAAWRACKALGYRRLITFTLPEEGGASLRASGWLLIGERGGGSWSRNDRPRVDNHPQQKKLRWQAPT